MLAQAARRLAAIGTEFAVAQSNTVRQPLEGLWNEGSGAGHGNCAGAAFPMELDMDIAASTPVDTIMRKWPGTIREFLNHRMNCPGCPIACFHTVADACREHHVDIEDFLAGLRRHATDAA